MTFTSFTFAVFLLLVWLGYWLLPHRPQKLFLLLASYLFYGFVHPWLCCLLFAVSLNSHITGERIRISPSPRNRKLWLCLGVVLNLGVLVYFKYADFFIQNFNSILLALGSERQFALLKIFLPIGISFYVFQGTGFIVDCYRKQISEKTSLLDFSLFVSFFPQLVAGPIERASNILPQLAQRRPFDRRQQFKGVELIVWGLFKKLVIADNVSSYVDQIFAVQTPSTLLILVGTLGFTVQIFADFSAYTDIARGSAKLLGIELIENFFMPYAARSPSDFWRRWHVSLSEWIRDYIYIPLGGSRCSPLRYVGNTMLTMFLCGLWHGAAWTFVVWGLYHGVLLVFNKYCLYCTSVSPAVQRFAQSKAWRFSSPLLMCTATVFGWLLFRAASLADVASYFSSPALDRSATDLFGCLILLGTLAVYSAPLLFAVLVIPLKRRFLQTESSQLSYAQLMTLALGILTILLAAPEAGEFIYFQF